MKIHIVVAMVFVLVGFGCDQSNQSDFDASQEVVEDITEDGDLTDDSISDGEVIEVFDYNPDDYPMQTWCRHETRNGTEDPLLQRYAESGNQVISLMIEGEYHIGMFDGTRFGGGNSELMVLKPKVSEDLVCGIQFEPIDYTGLPYMRLCVPVNLDTDVGGDASDEVVCVGHSLSVAIQAHTIRFVSAEGERLPDPEVTESSEEAPFSAIFGTSSCYGISAEDLNADGNLEIIVSCFSVQHPYYVFEQTDTPDAWRKTDAYDWQGGGGFYTVTAAAVVYPKVSAGLRYELSGVLETSDGQALFSRAPRIHAGLYPLNNGGFHQYLRPSKRVVIDKTLLKFLLLSANNGFPYGSLMGWNSILLDGETTFLISDVPANRALEIVLDSFQEVLLNDLTLVHPTLVAGGAGTEIFYSDPIGNIDGVPIDLIDQLPQASVVDITWALLPIDVNADGLMDIVATNATPSTFISTEVGSGDRYQQFFAEIASRLALKPFVYVAHPDGTYTKIDGKDVGFEPQDTFGFYCQEDDQRPECRVTIGGVQLRGGIQGPCADRQCMYVASEHGAGHIHSIDLPDHVTLHLIPRTEIVQGGSAFLHMREDPAFFADRPYLTPMPTMLSNGAQLLANGSNTYVVAGRTGWVLFPSGYVAFYDDETVEQNQPITIEESNWISIEADSVSFDHPIGVDSVDAVCFYADLSMNTLLECENNAKFDKTEQKLQLESVPTDAIGISFEVTVELPSSFYPWAERISVDIRRVFPLVR